MYMVVESKVCTRCGVKKPLISFAPDRRATDGRSSRCRACINAVAAERRHRKNAGAISLTQTATPQVEPQAEPQVDSKVCTRCWVTKPLTEFLRDTRLQDGHTDWCRECHNAMPLERYYQMKPFENPDEVVDPPAGTKFCTHCETEKPLDEFYRNKRNSDGRSSWCKECANAAARKSSLRKKVAKVAPEGATKVKSKTCTHCGTEKPLTEFFQNNWTPDGYSYRCQACILTSNRKRYLRKKAAPAPSANGAKPRAVSKVCTRCGTEKPLKEFTRNGLTRDGYSYWCHACQLAVIHEICLQEIATASLTQQKCNLRIQELDLDE